MTDMFCLFSLREIKCVSKILQIKPKCYSDLKQLTHLFASIFVFKQKFSTNFILKYTELFNFNCIGYFLYVSMFLIISFFFSFSISTFTFFYIIFYLENCAHNRFGWCSDILYSMLVKISCKTVFVLKLLITHSFQWSFADAVLSSLFSMLLC